MMTTLDGKWVFDSHLLVYAFDHTSPFFKKTSSLYQLSLQNSFQIVVAQQNIIEAERVLSLVYKKSPKEIIILLEDIISNFNIQVITPFPTTYHRFHDLLKTIDSGIDLFDYYLAATMLDNDLHHLATLNTKDFLKIKEIKAVNPFI